MFRGAQNHRNLKIERQVWASTNVEDDKEKFFAVVQSPVFRDF